MFSFFLFSKFIFALSHSLFRDYCGWLHFTARDFCMTWGRGGGPRVQLMGLRNIINQPSKSAHTHTHTSTDTHAHTDARAVSHVTGMSRCSFDIRYAICDGTHDDPGSLAATRAACVAICNYVITQTCNCNSICVCSLWHIALIALNCPTRQRSSRLCSSSWRLRPSLCLPPLTSSSLCPAIG